MRRERLWIGEGRVIAEELQAACLMGCDQLLQEQPAEQARGWSVMGRLLS